MVTHLKSSLAKHQTTSPLDEVELFAKKRQAWIAGEGLHLNDEQIQLLPQTHKWAIEIIGNLIYGKRV